MDRTLKGEKKAGRKLRRKIFNAKSNCLFIFLSKPSSLSRDFFFQGASALNLFFGVGIKIMSMV
jgi:hypothetical protein